MTFEGIKLREIGEGLFCLIWAHRGELVSRNVYTSTAAALEAAHHELERVHGKNRGSIILEQQGE